MKSDTNRYIKSVYLFPGIDVSEDINYLKQLHVAFLFGKKPRIMKKGLSLIDLKTAGERYVVDWFGDCIEIKDPMTEKFLFIGFLNNYLVGFGNIAFTINSKALKKLKIPLKIVNLSGIHSNIDNLNSEIIPVNGFILDFPYKTYSPKGEIFKILQNTKTPEAAWTDVKLKFKPAFDWKRNAPRLKETEDFEEIWADSWVLYRLNTYNPEGPFKYKWISPCRHTDYQYDKLAMWDTLHIAENIKWYDVDMAVNLLDMQFELIRSSDGMAAQDRSCGGDLDGIDESYRVNGNNFGVSQPPMMSYSFLELSKLVGHYNICDGAFELMVKNVKWWEKNRYIPEYRLFGYNMPASTIGGESGLDNSPRFFNQWNGKSWKKVSHKKNRKLIAVDLNAQMADYYQNLGVIAMMKEDERSNEFFAKAEGIIEDVQQYLWNDDEKFFFDYDIDMKKQQPIFAASSFWTLFGGCVLKGRLKHMIDHLMNPNKFWTELPLPSIAVDSQFYKDDMWQGPTWLSQNYWFIIGLKRYNQGSVAAQLARKCIKYLENSYYNYHKFYEFYNPKGISQKILKRKKKTPGPPSDYVGHLPLHSIYLYGMLGAEILDESVSFFPNWETLRSDINLEVFYDNKKHILDAQRNKTKILEVLRE